MEACPRSPTLSREEALHGTCDLSSQEPGQPARTAPAPRGRAGRWRRTRRRAGAPSQCPRRPGRQHQRPEGVGAAATQIVTRYPPSRFVETICKSRFRNLPEPKKTHLWTASWQFPLWRKWGPENSAMWVASRLEPLVYKLDGARWGLRVRREHVHRGWRGSPSERTRPAMFPASAAPTLCCGGTQRPHLECGEEQGLVTGARGLLYSSHFGGRDRKGTFPEAKGAQLSISWEGTQSRRHQRLWRPMAQ